MNIFISWSGERSRLIALTLRTWLDEFFHGVTFFVSEQDIAGGASWLNVINQELAKASFGILCLTPGNLTSPWLLFEAGALSNAFDRSKVAPFLTGLKKSDIKPPLGQFQSMLADEAGTLKLVQSINDSMPTQMTPEKIKRLFKKFWPDLKTELDAIPNDVDQSSVQPSRDLRDIVEEILGLVRNQNIQAAASPGLPAHKAESRDMIYLENRLTVHLKLFLNPANEAEKHFAILKVRDYYKRISESYPEAKEKIKARLIAAGLDFQGL